MITIVISPNPVIHICDTFHKHFFLYQGSIHVTENYNIVGWHEPSEQPENG